MVMVVILIVGASTILLSTLTNSNPRMARDNITADALAKAKEALIAYAISSENKGGATARPGNFPCPDTDAPGIAGYGDENVIPPCVAGAIGRLPWKTLGLPELKDSEGEPLWYALSGNFRKAMGTINSDTTGTLQVYDRDGITLLTQPGSEAVAIVFSPGRIVGVQQRNTNIDKITASNYLEAANGRDNSTTNGPFITADKSDSFNDRLIIIRTRDFMPIIEKRIAKELITILGNYRTSNGYYPYPAAFNSCKDTSNCDSDSSICRGNFPYNAITAVPLLPDWGGSYALPKAGASSWFVDNKWYRVIYYSAGTARLATAPVGCNASLNVSGNGAPGLLLMPGTPLGNIVRSYLAPPKDLTLYLEDAANYDNLDDTYVTPTSISNDQLYVLP